MSARTKNSTPPKRWLADVPDTSRVVIHEGEADTIDGCAGIAARCGSRILAINNALMAWRAYARTPEELERLADLESEFASLHEVRAAVIQRKNAIAQAIDVRMERSFRMAVKERFGPEVNRELSERAREIEADARRRHGEVLVGAIVPVGAVGGVRQRRNP